MTSPATTIRARLSSSALVIVFVCIVVGVYLANRAVSQSEEARTRLDALETASRVESFLAVRTEALYAFQGLFLDSLHRGEPRRLAALVSALGAHLGYFQHVWLADSAGTVFFARPAPTAGDVLRPGIGLDTVAHFGLRRAMREARTSGMMELSVADSIAGASGRAFLIVLPFSLGGAPMGFAVGSVPVAALRTVLVGAAPAERVQATIRVSGDTILAIQGAGSGPVVRARTTVIDRSGSERWALDVSHTTPEQLVRSGLVLISLIALGALLTGFVYERRQAERIAERSAELERLSAELLRANRAKSEFLANVSHELRTPLNAIVGFVDLLRDGVYGELGPRQVGPVERIEASANHLRHLVDQILDLAKMAAGRLEVHRELVDLRPFVFEVASEVEPLVTEKGLTISLSVGATLPRVRTDPSHLRQILVNLLGNAVKFTAAGTVTVRARLVAGGNGAAPDGGEAAREAAAALRARAPRAEVPWIALQVVDTGIGIAAAERERIFEEFEQVNAGPRGDSVRRGTGLGLSISRRLARLLGGDVTVESEVGRGSVFTLWLPVDPADLRRGTPVAPTGRARSG